MESYKFYVNIFFTTLMENPGEMRFYLLNCVQWPGINHYCHGGVSGSSLACGACKSC